jgi:drug/metabolite transporter (DMT)-like permease
MSKGWVSVRREHLLMVLTALFWALGHPLGRLIVATVHPLQLGAVNLAVGFLVLFAYILASGKAAGLLQMKPGDVAQSFALGALGFCVYQICTFSALARIPASMNAMLISTNVLFIVMLSAIFLKERITLQGGLGIAAAFLGAVLVTFNRGFTLSGVLDFTGILFSLSGAVVFALYTVFGKRVLARNDPLLVTALALFSGAVLLCIVTATTVGFTSLASVSAGVWAIMLALSATMIGVAYPLWFFCLKRLPASHASVFIYMTPIFAVILSLIILQERFSWIFWVGGALVLAGVAAANTKWRAPRAHRNLRSS